MVDSNRLYRNKEKACQINEPTVQPKYDYSDKTIHELHSVINDGLLYGQEVATKLENKTKPTADDKRKILTMKTMGQAYVQLANNTFKNENNGETFETLDNIKDHLNSKLPAHQLFRQKHNSDDED